MAVGRALSQFFGRTLLTLVRMFYLDWGLTAVVSVLDACIYTCNCVNLPIGLLVLARALVIEASVFMGLGCLLLSLLFGVNR